MPKLYALNEADRELLKRTIRKVDAFFKAASTERRRHQVVDVMPYFAKVKTAWSAATPNQVTATISYQDGALIAGQRDWTVYLSMPTTNKPTDCSLVVDDVIAFMPIYDVANAEWRGIIVGPSGSLTGVFPVTLTQTGGAQGSTVAAATWTYTVAHAITGVELATVVNPTTSPHQLQRPTVGQMIKATSGLAYYNTSGNLVLSYVNEMPGQEACP